MSHSTGTARLHNVAPQCNTYVLAVVACSALLNAYSMLVPVNHLQVLLLLAGMHEEPDETATVSKYCEDSRAFFQKEGTMLVSGNSLQQNDCHNLITIPTSTMEPEMSGVATVFHG